MGIPDKILDGIERLEPLPITVQKLLVALNDEDTNFNEITEAIEYDGAITANILRTANSAAFGGRARIEHIRDAVVRLGTITLLDIMLIGHLRSMRSGVVNGAFSEDELWLHGATASLAVKAIARETRNRKIPEASSIAALIHDIGKLILLRYFSAEMTVIPARCQENSLTLAEAEKELFGCDHAEVGGAIAYKWAFPEPITEAIARHHEASPADSNLMLDAVLLANLTAKTVGAGMAASGMNTYSDFAASNERLRLSAEGFEHVCAQTSEWMEDLRQNYGLLK
jgi:putative nucleotidyltransferase with HDIG domain